MGGDASFRYICHDIEANSRETSLNGDMAKRHDEKRSYIFKKRFTVVEYRPIIHFCNTQP